MMEDRTKLKLSIEGRVQGVGFRAWMVDVASRQGVDGWVRNRRDGSVEALVAGPKEAVDRLVAETRRGPPGSSVERVEAAETDEEPPGAGFDAAPTV